MEVFAVLTAKQAFLLGLLSATVGWVLLSALSTLVLGLMIRRADEKSAAESELDAEFEPPPGDPRPPLHSSVVLRTVRAGSDAEDEWDGERRGDRLADEAS